MNDINHVVLTGNLTRDPELRRINTGAAVADLGLAVSEVHNNKEGAKVESTCFVDVVAWSKTAEACAEFLKKGSPLLVEGRLQLDQWETKEGEKRSRLRVRAERVRFLGRGPNGNGNGQEEARPANRAPAARANQRMAEAAA